MKECWSCKHFKATDDVGSHGYCGIVKGAETAVNPGSICDKYEENKNM